MIVPDTLASPFPLMREVRLLPVSYHLPFPPFPPYSRFVLLWGAYAGLPPPPLPYPVSGHSERVCAPARGVPPPPPLVRGSFSPPYLACRAQGDHSAWGGPFLFLILVWVPTPLPLLLAVHVARVLLGGAPRSTSGLGLPSSLSPVLCTRGAHATIRGSSPLPPLLGFTLG